MGLVEEGQEVIERRRKRRKTRRPISRLSAPRSASSITRFPDIRRPATSRSNCATAAIVALLSKSLAEEENADQLLNQVARSLMSVAKMPAAIEQSSEAE